jgi:hypothetical protein
VFFVFFFFFLKKKYIYIYPSNLPCDIPINRSTSVIALEVVHCPKPNKPSDITGLLFSIFFFFLLFIFRQVVLF